MSHKCLAEALPFVGIERGGEFYRALKEYREGLDLGQAGQEGNRFNPFQGDDGGVLKGLSQTLEGCSYTEGGGVSDRLRGLARDGGCSLSLLFHNIRSARGPGLELLEAEMRGWGVQWDMVGLAEPWLDEASEKLASLKGYSMVGASRKLRQGGGVAIFVREGLTFRERPDIGTFIEGVFESVAIEVVRGRGRNDLVVVVYRPPGGSMTVFQDSLAAMLGKVRGLEAYILGDFNVDLLKSGEHRVSSDYLEGFCEKGFYSLLPTPY